MVSNSGMMSSCRPASGRTEENQPRATAGQPRVRPHALALRDDVVRYASRAVSSIAFSAAACRISSSLRVSSEYSAYGEPSSRGVASSVTSRLILPASSSCDSPPLAVPRRRARQRPARAPRSSGASRPRRGENRKRRPRAASGAGGPGQANAESCSASDRWIVSRSAAKFGRARIRWRVADRMPQSVRAGRAPRADAAMRA